MKAYVLVLLFFLFLFPPVGSAQEMTSWKDPDTGKEYFRCRDEAGKIMLTDSLALCQYLVGKSLEPKGAEPQKSTPTSPAKKPKTSAIPLWETAPTSAEKTPVGGVFYTGPGGERHLLSETGEKVSDLKSGDPSPANQSR